MPLHAEVKWMAGQYIFKSDDSYLETETLNPAPPVTSTVSSPYGSVYTGAVSEGASSGELPGGVIPKPGSSGEKKPAVRKKTGFYDATTSPYYRKGNRNSGNDRDSGVEEAGGGVLKANLVARGHPESALWHHR